MTHTDLFKMFKTFFPLYAEMAKEYFPNGKNSIRVRMDGINKDYIFTFHDKNDWKFETVNSFLKNNKK